MVNTLLFVQLRLGRTDLSPIMVTVLFVNVARPTERSLGAECYPPGIGHHLKLFKTKLTNTFLLVTYVM
jgi:hypothetical protein